MKSKKVFEQHTISVRGSEAIVSTVTVTERIIEIKSDDGIFCLLRKLFKWSPCDQWCHVVNQLKKRRAYIGYNGMKDGYHFSGR